MNGVFTMARTKRTNVKEVFISRTVDRSKVTFPTLDVKTMQGRMESVTLPGRYDAQEAMLALVELGYIPAGLPTIEADNVVLRWKLSDIINRGVVIGGDAEQDESEAPTTRRKRSNVKEVFISRTVERSKLSFPTLDVKTMQGRMESVTLPGRYDAQEAMLALVELGYIPAGLPTIEADNVVLRWKLSDIINLGQVMSDCPEYVEGQEE